MAFSSIRTVFGTWRHVQPSDMESQSQSQPVQITGTYTTTPLPLPSRAFTYASERPAKPSLPSTDAIDDFFGASRTTRTSDSRHDERPVPSSPPKDTALPPAYAYPLPAPLHADPAFDESELPSYAQLEAAHARRSISAQAEPVTLAQYFFKFGFFFPPLWFLSLFIFFSPLTAPAEWESTKTPAECEALLDAMRTAEAKWARRSIAAASILSMLIVILVVVVVSVSHS